MSTPRLVPVLDVWIPGKPEPQGSTSAFVPTRKGTKEPLRRADGSIIVNVTSDNPQVKKWRKGVGTIVSAALAREAGAATAPDPAQKPAAFVVRATYCLERKDSHYRTGRNAHLVSDGARAWPATTPDVDKLLRATLDAMTGIVYVDDSQVIDAIVSKRYAVPTDAGNGIGTRLRVDRFVVEVAADLAPALRERPRVDAIERPSLPL